MSSGKPSLWLAGLWLYADLVSGPISAPQPCDLNLGHASGQPTYKESIQSGSAVLPASAIEAFVCLWPDSSGKYLTRNSARGNLVT